MNLKAALIHFGSNWRIWSRWRPQGFDKLIALYAPQDHEPVKDEITDRQFDFFPHVYEIPKQGAYLIFLLKPYLLVVNMNSHPTL